MNKKDIHEKKIARLAREFDRRVAALPVGSIGEDLPIVRTLPDRPTGSSLSNLKARTLPKKTGWEERDS